MTGLIGRPPHALTMAFPAFLDACSLFSPTLTDTLLRIAEEGAFSPHWSQAVLDELRGAIVKSGVSDERVDRRIAQMSKAFPEAAVVGYGGLIDVMTCDPKDRHVLAAAVQSRCAVLITFNVRHFPTASTEPFHLEAITPDAFLLDQLDLYPAMVHRALVGQVTVARRPPTTLGQLLGRLARADVPAFAEEVRRREFG